MQRMRRNNRNIKGEWIAGLRHQPFTSYTKCCICLLVAKPIKWIKSVAKAFFFFLELQPLHIPAQMSCFAEIYQKSREGKQPSPPGVAVLRPSSATNHSCTEHITFSSPFKGCIRELLPARMPVGNVCQMLLRQEVSARFCSDIAIKPWNRNILVHQWKPKLYKWNKSDLGKCWVAVLKPFSEVSQQYQIFLKHGNVCFNLLSLTSLF